MPATFRAARGICLALLLFAAFFDVGLASRLLHAEAASSSGTLHGTLNTYAVLGTREAGPSGSGVKYILTADDGQQLSLDLANIAGLSTGPEAPTSCTQFVLASNASNDNSPAFVGKACSPVFNSTLRSMLRTGGARVVVHHPAGAMQADAASSLSKSTSVFNSAPLQVSGIQLLAPANASSPHRRLSAVRRPVSLLVAIVTACGRQSSISVSDIDTRVMPTYRQWFAAASYGRASLSSSSRVIMVDVGCSVATTCSGAENNIAGAAKQAGNWASGAFTNALVIMPDSWVDACKPGWGGLGVVGGDTTWVRNADYGLNHPNVGLHELLHNFNLAHANGADNTEYADSSCVLSGYYPDAGRVYYPNGPHQWQLGWVDFVDDLAVTSPVSRTYSLSPSSSPAKASNVLRLRSSSSSYYVNYRVRATLDQLPSSFDGSVLVQRLVGDQNAASPTLFVASLSKGQSITIDGFTLAFKSVDGSSAAVVSLDVSGSKCPSIPCGYSFYQGMDSGGNDLGTPQTTVPSSLAAACNGKSGCAGFNSNGWVKGTILPQSQWYRWTNDPCLGLYVKQQSAGSGCPPVPCGYSFYQGMDSGGNDLGTPQTTVPSSLAAACNGKSGCAGFNSNGWVKGTILPQSQWYRWTNDPCLGLYVKQ